jgi:hypothetical protein
MQLQPMNISGLVCASGGGVVTSISNSNGLDLSPTPADPGFDPL